MSLRLAYSSWSLPWSCCEEVVGYDKEEMESGDVVSICLQSKSTWSQ